MYFSQPFSQAVETRCSSGQHWRAISSPANSSEYASVVVEFYATVNDAQQSLKRSSNHLDLKLDGGPSSIRQFTGNAIFITSSLSVGTHIITLEALDDRATADWFHEITITDVEDAPTITIDTHNRRKWPRTRPPSSRPLCPNLRTRSTPLVTVESNVDGALCNDFADDSGFFWQQASVGDHTLFQFFDSSNTSASELQTIPSYR